MAVADDARSADPIGSTDRGEAVRSHGPRHVHGFQRCSKYAASSMCGSFNNREIGLGGHTRPDRDHRDAWTL